MNEQTTGRRDFQPDYAQLELNSRANWTTARENYRRLVLLWHPDKFDQRPQERAHAQQQFISMTKSYTRLRNFQRLHGRLPFESVKRSGTPNGRKHDKARGGTQSNNQSNNQRSNQNNNQRQQHSKLHGEPHDKSDAFSFSNPKDAIYNTKRPASFISDVDAQEFDAGLLGREQNAPAQKRHLLRSRASFISLLAGGVIMLGTAMAFFLLDYKANKESLERGREVVEQAPPSDFMPSTAEIRRNEAKGAFVQQPK